MNKLPLDLLEALLYEKENVLKHGWAFQDNQLVLFTRDPSEEEKSGAWLVSQKGAGVEITGMHPRPVFFDGVTTDAIVALLEQWRDQPRRSSVSVSARALARVFGSLMSVPATENVFMCVIDKQLVVACGKRRRVIGINRVSGDFSVRLPVSFIESYICYFVGEETEPKEALMELEEDALFFFYFDSLITCYGMNS